jgi:peroxiredoxin
MKPLRASVVFLVALMALHSRAASTETVVPDLTLEGTDDRSYALRPTVGQGRLTVFVFFSSHCPCVAAHDQRLIDLGRTFQAKGVQFYLVDSEVGNALERGKAAVQRRKYPFPILADPQAKMAKALKVEFAATAVVLDARGRVHYRGGIDSHERKVDPNTGRFYLLEALTALLDGKPPDPKETKSFGCYLRLD